MCVVAAIGGAAAAGSVVSSVVGANAAQSAADTQAQSAQQATAAQQQAAQQSIAAQQQAQQQAQANAQPWINAGSSALGQLGQLLGIAIPGTPSYSAAPTGGGAGMMTGGPTGGFGGSPAGTQASVLQALQNTPGYQFSLQQGLQGVENSAAARGMQLSGATLKDLNNYAQGTAQQTYGQNIGYLESLAGLGQSSSGQTASGALATGAGIGGTYGNLGAQIGSNLIGAGNARAAGQVGGANAIGGALGGLGQVGQIYAMNQLFNPSGGGSFGYTGQGSLFGAPDTGGAAGYGLSPVTGLASGVNYPMG